MEYQLFAQRLRPDNFVAVAAYGELGTGYICTDKALRKEDMSRHNPLSAHPRKRC